MQSEQALLSAGRLSISIAEAMRKQRKAIGKLKEWFEYKQKSPWE